MRKSEIKEGNEYCWSYADPQSGKMVVEKVKLVSTTVEGCRGVRVECAGSPEDARNKEFPPITEYDHFVEIETASGEKEIIKCGALRSL